MQEEYHTRCLESLNQQNFIQYEQNLVSMRFIITENKRNRYKILQKIGRGNYSTIYKAEDLDLKTFVAVKVQCLYKINQQISGKKRSLMHRLYKDQPINMRKCNNKHVLKCYEIYQNDDFRILILEYCAGGTLERYRETRIKNLSSVKEKQKEAIAVLSQIIDGLAEIHDNNMMHRDLKIQNIMFHEDVIKIIDLGLSKAFTEQNATTGTICGTSFTMAPEILNAKYTNKVDVWSIGIILYYLLNGNYPFVIPNSLEVKTFNEECAFIQAIISKSLNKLLQLLKSTYSNQIVDFLSHLLCIDPQQRFSWKQVCEDKIFDIYQVQLPNHHFPEIEETTFEQELKNIHPAN